MDIFGTIFDLKRFTIHDGPGIRTTVFFKGCPLDCKWCHNPESRSSEIEYHTRRDELKNVEELTDKTPIGCRISDEAVMREVVRDETFYDQSGGGVTFSGGEPMMQIDFLYALLQSCKKWGFHTAIDTCGHAPATDFENIYDLTDLFLFDIKLIDDDAHIKYTGVSNKLILFNLKMLAERGDKINIRVPMIPNVTDTDENLGAIAYCLEPLKSIRKISLLPYNKLGEDKIERYNLDRRPLHLDTQDVSALEEKALWFRSRGYEVQIGG
jgi:pyruvate formate lyase activating enzyme